MTIRKLISGDEARKQLFNGLKATADMVAVTAGPAGRNVFIQQQWGGTKVTKDGVTVAKSIQLPKGEGEGAKLMIEASEKTGNDAGDGTTATCILAKAICEKGMKLIDEGCNVTLLKRGIDTAVKDVVSYLKDRSKEITTKDQIEQVARISANNDSEIGELIANAIEKVGKTGVVTVEKANSLATSVEMSEGMEIDQGLLSPYFITNLDKSITEFDDALLFLYDGKINSLKQILPLLEQVSNMGKPLVFIVDDVDDSALGALIANHLKGTLHCCVIKAPSFGDMRKDIMEDIAVLTGGTFVSTVLGQNLENVSVDVLGCCKHIKVSQTKTTIVGGEGDKAKIAERVEHLKTQIAETQSSYDKEKFQERLAKLTSGCAIIKVGAATEVELNEKKDRVDDAICATKAALEEGILPGGGIMLLKAKDCINSGGDMPEDFKKGYNLVFEALPSQFETIVKNAGCEVNAIKDKIYEDGNETYGYDVLSGEYGDMYEMGVIDPTKVIRIALQNAASVAGQLLTAEGLLLDDVDEIMKMNALAKSFQAQ